MSALRSSGEMRFLLRFLCVVGSCDMASTVKVGAGSDGAFIRGLEFSVTSVLFILFSVVMVSSFSSMRRILYPDRLRLAIYLRNHMF